MKLLHIDASITGENSVSRQVAAAAVQRLVAVTPGLQVSYRDLAKTPLAHLTVEHLPTEHPLSATAKAESPGERALSGAILHEFVDADIVVVGASMYNFSIPSQLKAWIDRILVPGVTFKYADGAVRGLAAGKRVILVISRGGLYGADSPAAAAEHVETYLRTVLGFIGVTNPEIIIAEGINMGPDARKASVDAALRTASSLAAAA
jgi:FMN-dependent NADH-azoreductase